MTDKNDDPRLSIEQIENMTPQQLAQLLSNLVNVLQRMPNEPLKNLQRIEKALDLELDSMTKGIRGKKARLDEAEEQEVKDLPDWLS